MGVDGTAGRLIEPGERERGEQAVETSALLVGYGDGGEKSLLRGRVIGGVALQQDFAAKTVEECVAEVVLCFVCDRQRLDNARQSSFKILLLGFKLGEQPLEPRYTKLLVSFYAGREGLSQLRHADLTVAEPGARPSGLQPKGTLRLHLMSLANLGVDFRGTKCGLSVAEGDFVHGLVIVRIDEILDAIGLDRARDRSVDQVSRSFNIAQHQSDG